MINWCNNCVLPDTRPNIEILKDGMCNACRFHISKKKNESSKLKKKKLKKIFELVKRTLHYFCNEVESLRLTNKLIYL